MESRSLLSGDEVQPDNHCQGKRIFLAARSAQLFGYELAQCDRPKPPHGKPIATSAAVPNRIALWGYQQVSAADHNGYFEMHYVPAEVPLYEEDFEDPRWIEHPSLGNKVDIAAIDITEAMAGFQIMPANSLESDAHIDLRTSQDVFVVGFPFGRMQNAPAPIWKRGSVALDPSLDLEGLPKMLIDTATREGMSGSVVIGRHIVVGSSYSKKDGSMSSPVLYSKLDLVAGIYSGRHYPDLDRAQLGIVWKRSAIEGLFEGRSPGD